MRLLSVTILFSVSRLILCDTDNPYLNLIDVMLLLKPKPKVQCVRSCRGMPDGDYHSCKGCLYFATCTNGYLVDARKCAWFGGLLWDDNLKRCEWTSSTCDYVDYQKPQELPNGCVQDCFGLPNGDYQSCYGCRVFVTCSNSLTYDYRPCPWLLVWDDLSKRCMWRSRTCKEHMILKPPPPKFHPYDPIIQSYFALK